MIVRRTGILLKPDCSRVLLRSFDVWDEGRQLRILGRIMSLSERDVAGIVTELFREFDGRHQHYREFVLRRYQHVRKHLTEGESGLTENRRILIGAYFTQEYALESAALFNPSIVWHPDQSGLQAGTRRFITSLRATGEGHISSICFRSGTVCTENEVRIDSPGRFVAAGDVVPDASYDRRLFTRKLAEIGISSNVGDEVLEGLEETF